MEARWLPSPNITKLSISVASEIGEKLSGNNSGLIGSLRGRHMLKRNENPPLGVMIPTSPMRTPVLLYCIERFRLAEGIHSGKPKPLSSRCRWYKRLLCWTGSWLEAEFWNKLVCALVIWLRLNAPLVLGLLIACLGKCRFLSCYFHKDPTIASKSLVTYEYSYLTMRMVDWSCSHP